MRKERKSPQILKPMIDEETALRFASAECVADSETAKDPSLEAHPRKAALKQRSRDDNREGMRQISITLKRGLYERIAKDAARKERTVAEHLQRHLVKHFGK
jgi:hypothetical protein